jgi:hypothetical protein
MLPRSSVDFIPAGKAPQRGADAVKVGYTPLKSAFRLPIWLGQRSNRSLFVLGVTMHS